MAKFNHVLQVELDPHEPVKEACSVIDALISLDKPNEPLILQGIKDAINKRLNELKEVSK